ncbi:unnamed protein product [Linum tenue]|nr:unnamed protein product [Linum tenue]
MISKDKDNFKLEVRTEEALVLCRETDSCPLTIVIGKEVEKRRIIQLLLNSNCEDSSFVVPIVGIGGLGKTMLTQLVYCDDQVKAHFEIRVWVYVSQKFDIKGILGMILQSISRESQPDLALDVLKDKIQEEICGRRFLFVLDDVWEENVESWEALGKYLKVGGSGSRVLVTTRSKEVAEISSRILKLGTRSSMMESPYFLEGLSLDESWSLMVEKALHGKVPQNPNVERTGKEILRKCCGVPLAVSTIAGLLRSKDPETEWSLFSENDLTSISEEKNLTMSTLRLSFNHLPSHLKRCFTYCKLFPKGCKLYVQPLVQLWIAQGYIESGDEGSEEMGLHCFKMLWWRSFFQEVKMDKLGNIETCKIHDLVHDLASSLTGAKILKISDSSAPKNISSKTRHLAVMQGTRVGAGYIREASKSRTFMCHMPIEKSRKIIRYFRFLRVLVISLERDLLYWRSPLKLEEDSWLLRGHNRQDSELFDCIGELKHLRFLRFSCQQMTKLPDSVTNLLTMQVLDLSLCSHLTELPRDIRKLVNLKHLYLDPSVKLTHMPKGIGELASLQTLKKFVVGTRTSGDVGGLNELNGLIALRGELTIESLTNAVPVGIYILKKQLCLKSLVLKWNELHYSCYSSSTNKDEEILEKLCPHPNLKKLEIHHYGGLKLPNWLSITNLVEISLAGCWSCAYLPSLHKLPSLKKLHILNCPNLKGINIENAEEEWPCFPCLSHLEILNCPNLTCMPLFPTIEQKLFLRRTSSQALVRTMIKKVAPDTEERMSSSYTWPPLSKLTHLRLEGIDDLESLPEEGMHNLTSLQELLIFECPRLASLPQAVKHLPSLQTSNIRGCPQLSTERCSEGEEEDIISLDFQKTSMGSGIILPETVLQPAAHSSSHFY